MPCSSSSRVTKKAAFSMQSRERLLTPLLKYFVLALAHGILGNISEEYYDITWHGPGDSSTSDLSNWPVSGGQSPQFILSFGRRWRVIEDPLNLELNLPGAQESTCLVHPKTKVATPVVNRYVVTVLPMLHSVCERKRGKRGRKKV